MYQLDLPCKPYPPWTIKGGVEWVLNPSNHHTPTQIGRMVITRKEAQTYLNSHVSHVPLFIAFVSTPSLKSSHKSMIVGTHRGAHEIKLHENNGISFYNQVPSRLQVVSGLSCVSD
jgi:hypothetical protein